MNENVFIIGYGMVGKATAKALDIPYFFSKKDSNITLKEGATKKFCLICLPTPTDEKGGQGESIQVMLEYIKQIVGFGGHPIFVVRSTVLPGTCRYLIDQTGEQVVSNPEFLSEATAYEDSIHPRIKVIGADQVPALRAVKELWRSIPCKLTIETDTVTSETIKYVFNTFAMTKVTFANQIYDICQRVGADYEKIHEALHKHAWGSKHHFRVLDKGGRGAGGRCIPKDVKAFAKWSNMELFKVVEKINTEYLNSSHKD